MKRDDDYLERLEKRKETREAVEYLYKVGLGCGLFFIGISSILLSLAYLLK